MASGDTLFVLFPAMRSGPTNYGATPDIVADTGASPMLVPVLDFDGAIDEHADFFLTLPAHYSGTTGMTFSYKYAMDGSSGVGVELEFRGLHIDDQTVLTGDLNIDTQTPIDIIDTPDATADDFNYSTTGSMAKANFNSASAGDMIAIRVTRDISFATNADDLQLAEVYVTET